MIRGLLILACFTLLSKVGLAQDKIISKFVPNHVKVQFAGTIGFLSVGIGYESPNKKFQGDFYYGFVPESIGGVNIHSVTGKLTWIAVSSKWKDDVKVDFLTAGVLINYAFGKQYFLFDPDKYDYDYYGFPTAAHGAIFIGGGIAKKKVGLYYEIGTTGKGLLSYVKNTRSLPFVDLLNLGIGVRVAVR